MKTAEFVSVCVGLQSHIHKLTNSEATTYSQGYSHKFTNSQTVKPERFLGFRTCFTGHTFTNSQTVKRQLTVRDTVTNSVRSLQVIIIGYRPPKPKTQYRPRRRATARGLKTTWQQNYNKVPKTTTKCPTLIERYCFSISFPSLGPKKSTFATISSVIFWQNV